MLVNFVLSQSLAPRMERKYKLPFSATFLLTACIKTAPLGLRSIYYPRQVNNIYFDTHSLSLFQSNLIGAAVRSKLRLRWYGDHSTQVIKPNLEVKAKIGYLTYKYIFPLNKSKRSLISSSLIKKNIF